MPSHNPNLFHTVASSKPDASQQQSGEQASYGLWHCRQCSLWWGSLPASTPQTWRLMQLFSPLPDPLLWDTDSPTWLVSGPDPGVCPHCGATMQGKWLAPARFGAFGVG